MQNIRKEFYVSPEGETHVIAMREDKLLKSDPQLVEALYKYLKHYFEEAIDRCFLRSVDLNRGKALLKFHTVDRFVRCNFSNRDLVPDVNEGRIELEDVPCHLRGVCEDENVICRPKCTRLKYNEERTVAEYCMRYDALTASRHAFESCSGTLHKLQNIRKRLGMKTNAELLRFFKGIHLERRLALV